MQFLRRDLRKLSNYFANSSIEPRCLGLRVPRMTSPRCAVMVGASRCHFVLFGPNDVFDTAMVDAGPVSAVDESHGFGPVGTLKTLLEIDSEVLFVQSRNRGAAIDINVNVEALRYQVNARQRSALSAPETRW